MRTIILINQSINPNLLLTLKVYLLNIMGYEILTIGVYLQCHNACIEYELK